MLSKARAIDLHVVRWLINNGIDIVIRYAMILAQFKTLLSLINYHVENILSPRRSRERSKSDTIN